NAIDLRDATLVEKICGMLRLRPRSFSDFDSAVIRGQKLGTQGVLFGTVYAFSSDNSGEARIDLELQLVDVAGRKTVFRHRYTEKIGGGVLSPAAMARLGHLGYFNRVLA